MNVVAKMALPTNKWMVLGEQSLLVAVASALTYTVEHVGGDDFGQYTPLVVALATVVLNYLKKVIDNPAAPAPHPVPPPTPLVDDGIDFPLGKDPEVHR